MQFWGYDARIAGNATTSLTAKDGKTYGSWSEYGAFVTGANSGDLLASGAAYSGGVATLPNQLGRSALTFANTTTPTGGWGGQIGYDTSLIHALESMCDTKATEPLRSLGGPVNGTKVLCNLGGTVEITKDITQSALATVGPSTPQIVIIAKNIVIDPDATNVEAWLVAVPTAPADGTFDLTDGGLINTCYVPGVTGDAMINGNASFYDFGTIADQNGTAADQYKLGHDGCKNQLKIIGPVMSRGIYLNRTTDASHGDNAGEVFNLRADAFIWAYNGGGGASSQPVAQTVSIKELPPRF